MKLFIYIVIFFKIFFFQNLLSDEVFLKGKEIFLNSGNCATCHSLKDAGSVANIGPSLDEIRPVVERVKNAVVNGIGVMPSAMGVLSDDEIDAVSYYVFKSTNNQLLLRISFKRNKAIFFTCDFASLNSMKQSF